MIYPVRAACVCTEQVAEHSGKEINQYVSISLVLIL
jgi:hypothetical protein